VIATFVARGIKSGRVSALRVQPPGAWADLSTPDYFGGTSFEAELEGAGQYTLIHRGRDVGP
jgi:hypothetical protein